jgi:hypothetical protein
LIFSVLALAADPASAHPPHDHPIFEKILITQKLLSDSSATAIFTTQEIQKKSHLLEMAHEEAHKGNIKEAEKLLARAGSQLYAGNAESNNKTVAELERWVDELIAAMAAMIPRALEIAKEKDLDLMPIESARTIKDKGLKARDSGDLELAASLLYEAYSHLEQLVANMRSGDNLTVELPQKGTEAAWLDSARRYEDWLFIADWLKDQSQAMQLDEEYLENAKRKAEALFALAKKKADDKRWLDANKLVDEAYSVMETAWRDQGVDI